MRTLNQILQEIKKIDTIRSEKIKAIALYLNKEGFNITCFGKTWTGAEGEWIYFNTVLNIKKIQELFDPEKELELHENRDPKSGTEKGLIDNTTGEAVMGLLKKIK